MPTLVELNDPPDGRPKLATISQARMVSYLAEQHIKNAGLPPDFQTKAEAKLLSQIPHNDPEYVQRMAAQSLHTLFDHHRVYSLTKRYDNFSLWAKYAADHTGYCLEFVNDGLFGLACEVNYGEKPLVDVTDPDSRDPFFIFCKSPDWSNEEEVRIFSFPGSKAEVKIEPQWLTRVILGMKMTEVNRKLICKWAKQRQPELAVSFAFFDALHQKLRLRDPP